MILYLDNYELFKMYTWQDKSKSYVSTSLSLKLSPIGLGSLLTFLPHKRTQNSEDSTLASSSSQSDTFAALTSSYLNTPQGNLQSCKSIRRR